MATVTDCLVLGSGIAGLSFALRAAAYAEVWVVTKRRQDDAATQWAQGGVAAVLSGRDTFEQHAADTHVAGAGLCHEKVVELCVRGGPQAIAWLMEIGARFSENEDGELDLAREGGHSARRVVHAADLTGREVQRALLEAVRRHPRIRLSEWHMGVDLITVSEFGGPDRCIGAYVFDEDEGKIETVLAHATVLATGGAGKVYLYSTNPDVATGDGPAMAYRAGAWLGNMEFFQFHPTCLFHPTEKSFLISEALRGEGARLCFASGEPFMPRHHAKGDLAPRDVVARAIDFEMKRGGMEHVYLDISHKPASFVRERFPGIHSRCQNLGYDLTAGPIPVVPAAHYMCGGVASNLHGRSSVPGLWVLGETAFTGLHGANRLASNSLLEGLVFAHRAADRLADEMHELRKRPLGAVPEWQVGSAVASDEAVVVTHNWDELRRTMWNYVGIVRSDARLSRAARRIALLEDEIHDYYWKHLVTRDLLELRNIAVVARLVIESATARKESRGLHFTIDYPGAQEAYAQDTVVKRGVGARLRDAAPL